MSHRLDEVEEQGIPQSMLKNKSWIDLFFKCLKPVTLALIDKKLNTLKISNSS